MQKNMISFIVLSILTFVGWSWYMHKAHPIPPASLQAPAVKLAPGSPSTQGSQAAVTAVPAAHNAKLILPSAAAKKEERVTVSSKSVEAVLSSRGAKIVSWKLLPYHEHKNSNEQVQLVPAKVEDGDYAALEMAGADLQHENWTLETPAPRVRADGAREVSFVTKLPGAPVAVRKTFIFDNSEFMAHVRVELTNQGKQDLKLGRSFLVWGPGVGQPEASGQGATAASSVVHLDKAIERERAGKEDKTFSYANPRWTAQKNHYFVAAFIPEGNDFTEAETRRFRNGTLTTAMGPGELLLKAGETRRLEVRLYAGPQIYERLSGFGVNLQRVVQFQAYGIFEWLNPLCVGMLHVLRWFYAVTGNWGMAIILLTVLVRGALFYPSQKSMVSMRRMQTKMAAMQPRLAELKKIHKDDAQKLNAEMMRLYKEYGVNPLGGCLPMLAQIPVFFALYGTLMAAFEIRGAPFFWKWDDLSGPDPTYLFSLFMGATMFLQQRMAPTSSATMSDDQAQMQKMMMYLMPVMFTGMAIMFKWPMGLLLYWSVSNLFGIGQQWYVNKTVK